jgi:hypothetical protein
MTETPKIRRRAASLASLVAFLCILAGLLWWSSQVWSMVRLGGIEMYSPEKGYHGYSMYNGEKFRSNHGVWGTEGRFAYYYYFLNLFPVMWKGGEPDGILGPRTEDEARQIVVADGSELYTEYEYAVRTCRWGVYALLVADAHARRIFTGIEDCMGLTLSFVNTVVSTFALVVLFASFWFHRQRVLGLVAVLVIWSHPFMVENFGAGIMYMMGWVILICCFLLALNLPLIFNENRKFPWPLLGLIPLLSGIVLGIGDQIRGEIAVNFAAPLMVYLTATTLPRKTRAILVVVFLVSWQGFDRLAESYWDAKYEEASALVAQAGGHVWSGDMARKHPVWPAVWCGLGDFGGKHGFVWDDGIDTAYAWRLLRDKYGYTDADLSGFHDEQEKFRKFFWHHGPVEDIFRRSVLGKIRRDPIWFVGVAVQRVIAVFDVTIPLFLSIPPERVVIPLSGWLVIPLVVWLWFSNRRPLAKVILFTLPLAGIMLLITTEFEMPYFNIYHLMAVAVICSLLWGGLVSRVREASWMPAWMAPSQSAQLETRSVDRKTP